MLGKCYRSWIELFFILHEGTMNRGWKDGAAVFLYLFVVNPNDTTLHGSFPPHRLGTSIIVVPNSMVKASQSS
jgi:hypothetical protein